MKYEKFPSSAREEDKTKVRDLLLGPEKRKALLERKTAPFTEEQLSKAEDYINGSEVSEEAHHQFTRLLLEATMADDWEEEPGNNGPARTVGRSARKPSLDDYDRMMK